MTKTAEAIERIKAALAMRSYVNRELALKDACNPEAIGLLLQSHAALLEALRFYGNSCDATESTPCGYEGNLCCKVARAAIQSATQSTKESTNG